MFLHGSWIHIIGNMWFLWIFGDNVEDAMGAGRFMLFYLLCGLVAAIAQTAPDPESIVPMVGASGAIGGVMGAYARLYPKAHVHALVFLGFFITTGAVPAVYMLGYWFLIQFLSGLPALGSTTGGVAFWAHVGGFLCGLILVPLFQRPEYLAATQATTGTRDRTLPMVIARCTWQVPVGRGDPMDLSPDLIQVLVELKRRNRRYSVRAHQRVWSD
jgi:membrane associated rhomboid family serine protease